MKHEERMGNCGACGEPLEGVHYAFTLQTNTIQSPHRGDTPADGATMTFTGLSVRERFCCSACCKGRLADLLQAEGLPAEMQFNRVLAGPIATCGKCAKPVDLTDSHVAYTKGKHSWVKSGDELISEIDYCDVLAVVCALCAGMEEMAHRSKSTDASAPEIEENSRRSECQSSKS